MLILYCENRQRSQITHCDIVQWCLNINPDPLKQYIVLFSCNMILFVISWQVQILHYCTFFFRYLYFTQVFTSFCFPSLHLNTISELSPPHMFKTSFCLWFECTWRELSLCFCFASLHTWQSAYQARQIWQDETKLKMEAEFFSFALPNPKFDILGMGRNNQLSFVVRSGTAGTKSYWFYLLTVYFLTLNYINMMWASVSSPREWPVEMSLRLIPFTSSLVFYIYTSNKVESAP